MKHLRPLCLGIVAAVAASACGKQAPNPFVEDAGTDATSDTGASTDGDVFDAPGADGGADADPFGRPCQDDKQCNDDVDCTTDVCDPDAKRCRHVPDDSMCANTRYCDGVERCDVKLGCLAGAPVTCSDDNSCTIDRCDEASHACHHEVRDVDGDGDGDWHCDGGGDCDDLNPLVSSKAHEVCANQIDDDCDGETDEDSCSSPAHDTCFDALILTDSVPADMSTNAAKGDYSASCFDAAKQGLRDVVAALKLPAGGPFDVQVTAKGPDGVVSLSSSADCANPVSTELACDPGWIGGGGNVSRMVVRQVAGGTTLPIFVFSTAEQTVQVRAQALPSSTAPSNETCGTWATLQDDQLVTSDLFGAARDMLSACDTKVGEVVYKFTLTEPKDVHLRAQDMLGLGKPVLSLRDSKCDDGESELACVSAKHLFRRALPAGDYFVTLSGTVPSVFQLSLHLDDPTQAPPDDTCPTSPDLSPGQQQSVILTGYTDAVPTTCLPGALDAAYALHLTDLSDVLLTERYSKGDTGGVSLWKSSCADGDMLGCHASTNATVRLIRHQVPAGDYRFVVETANGNPAVFTAFVRKSVAPVLVPFSDDCATAQVIPSSGGTFQGNTTNMTALYPAGCDQGSAGSPLGAPEQMLKLVLKSKKRVVFDMRGSNFSTLLDIRKGPSCPGTEVLHGCAAGYDADQSYVDVVLEPGEYFVQVDGYYGATGQWLLDVFTADM